MAQITDYKAGCHYADGKPGRYVCFSTFVVDGVTYEIEHECRNPEIGRRVVFEREGAILRKLGAPTREVSDDCSPD
ncbi:hypothetical protein APY04_0817 [Hyphomicrobium sulfonivorans]|uniref:Uncharacterized protein n=1 Tax=Hyphomicrobium sulfonivorans TaxID=121290 RepID=A0A109BLA9_HYPSL|nr:hypothetical protein [Hyphomicrobium sulfonivorans]KWT70756.1 hypothetical protein APY04_0817 [Hyphomicrobium sulfonivorans]